ncbi:hypothetical protein [Candidatus Villigracilis saccharophilus]|uniref:hypothetical protein n=1 Tax=Candidatus Villigracilis saccharophilus TaxID=3140684 RepID=UPI0031373245|nr:hypothetical protein [Anaerolineales bacterium]
MKKSTPRFLKFCLILFLLASCTPKPSTPDPGIQIRQAVAATLAALPTVTPVPPPTSYPSPTPFSLTGLFCEYQFCIGHPADMAFYDVSAQQNPLAPSSYGQGMIAAINSTLFIQVIWQTAPGTADPKFMLDLVLEEVDLPVGNLDVKLVRTMNVMYTAITSTATTILPFGAAGAWTCGDRVFAWKVYSPQDQTTAPLFEEMLARFTCGQN